MVAHSEDVHCVCFYFSLSLASTLACPFSSLFWQPGSWNLATSGRLDLSVLCVIAPWLPSTAGDDHSWGGRTRTTEDGFFLISTDLFIPSRSVSCSSLCVLISGHSSFFYAPLFSFQSPVLFNDICHKSHMVQKREWRHLCCRESVTFRPILLFKLLWLNWWQPRPPSLSSVSFSTMDTPQSDSALICQLCPTYNLWTRRLPLTFPTLKLSTPWDSVPSHC